MTDIKTVTAGLANGGRAEVTARTGANNGLYVVEVKMPDGTVLARQGTANHWLADGGGPGKTVWDGDVLVNPDGELRFVYHYEKVPSVVSVEAHLPAGGKVARAVDGHLILPSCVLDAIKQRLPEAGVQALKELGLDVAADRLQLHGVSAGLNVNTRYSVNLSQAEAAALERLAASDGSVKIVPAKTQIAPVTGNTFGTTAGECTGSTGYSAGAAVEGRYEYPDPMPDHTSTISVFCGSEEGKWKVLTGLRLHDPFAGKLALPGGFLDRAGGVIESPLDAAIRELAEETGIQSSLPELVGIGDAPGRDRRNRIIDFQYVAVATAEQMSTLFAGDDLHSLALVEVQKLLDDPHSLAFDHHQALSAAYKHLLARPAAVR